MLILTNKKPNQYIIDTYPVELSGRVQIIDTGDLLISNVREADAGLYSCERSNEAGTVNGEAWLGVMGKFSVYSKKKNNFCNIVNCCVWCGIKK